MGHYTDSTGTDKQKTFLYFLLTHHPAWCYNLIMNERETSCTNGKDKFCGYANHSTSYYIKQLAKLGCPKELVDLATEITSGKPVDSSNRNESGSQSQIVKWDGCDLYYYAHDECGFERIQIIPECNGYVDFCNGYE